jgi:RNA polymerase-binding transcription factor DksA
MEKIDSLK